MDNPTPDFQGARIALGVSIEAAATATRIKRHYLEWLEQGQLDKFPSPAQAQGFGRAYASFLGIDNPGQRGAASQIKSPAEPAPAVDHAAAEQIFAALGARLKFSRERLGLSLPDTASHTHIPEHYLGYMEAGDFGAFPSPVQARGMLSNYAAFLGTEENELLLQFAEGLQAGHQARAAADTSRPRARRRPWRLLPSWLAPYLSREIVLIALLSSGLTAIFLWSTGQVLSVQGQLTPQPTAPPLGQAVLSSPTPEPSATEASLAPQPELPVLVEAPPEEATPVAITPEAGQGPIQVFLIVRQRTYLRVIVDGVEQFDGRAAPGANLSFSGQQTVSVAVGNGAAVQAYYNQTDLGALGIQGEAISITFTPEEVTTPTATVASGPPTPTATAPP